MKIKRIGALILGALIILVVVTNSFVASETDMWYYCNYVHTCTAGEQIWILLSTGAAGIMVGLIPGIGPFLAVGVLGFQVL